MRRIQRDACHEELVKNLTSGDGAIFKEIWRLLLFAAALGIHDGRRRPLVKSESGKAIPDTYFSTPAWRGFLYLMGVAETGNSACLHGNEESQEFLVTAFEEYANNGLHILAERLRASSSPFEEFVSFMLEVVQPATAGPILDDLI